MAPVRANTIGTSGTNKSRYDQSINARTVDIFNYVHISEVYRCATRSAHFQHVTCKKPSCPPRAPHTPFKARLPYC
jgi:hypothetical protein